MENYEERKKENEKKQANRRVYSTAVINQLIADRGQGYDIPYDAFFNRDVDLRNAGITFKMTAEELEEYQKCYDDPEYFVDNYCRFMTDNGLATVELRDYQKKVIDVVTKEKFDSEINDYVPEHHNIIWIASRQVGKCSKCLSVNELDFSNTEKIEKSRSIPNKIFIEEKYYNGKSNIGFLNKILYGLSIIYRRL